MKAETQGEVQPGRIRTALLLGLFLLLLFTPPVLTFFSRAVGISLDVRLIGFVDPPKQPEWSLEGWLEGEMQNWVDQELRNPETVTPGGLMIKTYNTLNWMLFRKSERILGLEDDIFETEYIQAELILTEADDFSLPENLRAMEEHVSRLEKLNALLKERGKSLVYYIAPSKASAHRENIPRRYFAISREGVRAVDALREKMAGNGIPFLICGDLRDSLTWPDFYSTGIHWSRTYEQLASKRILEMMKEASGRNYRSFGIGEVKAGIYPFWRDTDVLDLANIFLRPSETYYEYETVPEEGSFDPLRVLIQGDSFAMGLRKDLLENDLAEELCFITRNQTVERPGESSVILEGDWSRLDWADCLDRADVIVVEATEPLIRDYSYGFTEALLSWLEQNSGEGAG